MIIREAKPCDLEQIWNLIIALAINENCTHKVKLQMSDISNYLFGETPCLFTLVAEEDNTIQGIALYYYRVSSWVGKTLHLEDLIVDEAYRGKGIGSKLFKSLAEVAIRTEARRMDWEVSFDNLKGRAFYAQQGANFEENWRICRMEYDAILALSE